MPSNAMERSSESLQKFFERFVWRHFFEDVNLQEPRLAGYVTNLLAEFARTDRLYRIHNAEGRRLEQVVEMLIESHPLLDAGSFDRERAVRKHVGDYTLFMTGLFPESVARQRFAKPLRLDAFVDYVKAGKESYRIVSAFDQFEYRDEAPLFRELAENFELCVMGLNLVKQDLDELQRDYYAILKKAAGNS